VASDIYRPVLGINCNITFSIHACLSMTLPTPQYIFETIWQGFFDKETTNSDMFTREDTVFLCHQWRF